MLFVAFVLAGNRMLWMDGKSKQPKLTRLTFHYKQTDKKLQIYHQNISLQGKPIFESNLNNCLSQIINNFEQVWLFSQKSFDLKKKRWTPLVGQLYCFVGWSLLNWLHLECITLSIKHFVWQSECGSNDFSKLTKSWLCQHETTDKGILPFQCWLYLAEVDQFNQTPSVTLGCCLAAVEEDGGCTCIGCRTP